MLATHAAVLHPQSTWRAIVLIALLILIFWRAALRTLLMIVIVAAGAGVITLLHAMIR